MLFEPFVARFPSSHVPLPVHLFEERARLHRIRINTSQVVKLSKRITEEMRIEFALNHIQPSAQSQPARASGEPLIVPHFFMTAECRRGCKPFEPGQRLREPSFDALRQARCLCDQLLRFVDPPQLFAGTSEQE